MTLHNDVATVPLYFEFRYAAMSEKLHGYGPSPGHHYRENGDYFKHAWLE